MSTSVLSKCSVAPQTGNARRPFCKVCFDAGKTKAEYTTHWVKDKQGPDGKIVCPYLLALDCRYCKGKGHTIKHCLALKQKNQQASEWKTQQSQTHEGQAREGQKQQSQGYGRFPLRQPDRSLSERWNIAGAKKRPHVIFDDTAPVKYATGRFSFSGRNGKIPQEKQPSLGPEVFPQLTDSSPVKTDCQLDGWASIAKNAPELSVAPPPPPVKVQSKVSSQKCQNWDLGYESDNSEELDDYNYETSAITVISMHTFPEGTCWADVEDGDYY